MGIDPWALDRGRGYQDIATALLTVQAWAGANWKAVVPEGVDDATLHGTDRAYRVQVKSRHDPRGLFSATELAKYIAHSVAEMDAEELQSGRVEIVLLLERPVDGIKPTGFDSALASDPLAVQMLAELLEKEATRLGISAVELLAATHLLVISNPADVIVDLVVARTGCIEAAGRLVADRLRQRAGALADTNYRATAQAPAVINATDVQHTVDDVLAIVDPDAVLVAVAADLCEPVTFAAVNSPGFYEGVDVTPGHVGAGLVLERPDVNMEITRALQRRRACLVTGPSGSGKSACAWLAAHEARHAVRWYHVRRAPPEQVHVFLDLARALEASAERPVGFVFDDLGRDLAGGWDALRRLSGGQPGVLMLGTVREEDLYLVSDLAGIPLVRPMLDEPCRPRLVCASC